MRISNCGNRSDTGKLSRRGRCIGPDILKRKLKISAVRTESSKINASVARAKNRRPGIAPITLMARVKIRTPPRRASGVSRRIGPVRNGEITADETRRMVFAAHEGKVGYRWWLWVFLGEDTVVFRLDPTRSHEVPEGHFPKDARVVLMVDRYSAYKAMEQVKLGNVVLVVCWAHVRRDFIKVGKGWAEHKEWALAWLRRIRALYHHDRRRRSAKPGSADSAAADIELRQTVAAMQTQADAELADPKLPTPCRNLLTSLREHSGPFTF